MKRVCFILTLILTLLLAVSCSKGDGTAHTGDENGGTGGQNGEFTVTFDSAGGTPLPSLKVASGSLIEWPTPPEKKGYLFLGWYCDGVQVSSSQSFNSLMPAGNVTLTAKFKYNPASPDDPDRDGSQTDVQTTPTGDVNKDGTVNVLDIVAVVNYSLAEPDENMQAYDVNNDGAVNVLDIVAVVNKSME